jgi:branched-chain amino acid transport system permease protein
VVRSLGELAKLIAGDAPGVDLVIYGAVLVIVVAVAPQGVAGLLHSVTRRVRVGRGETVPEANRG